MCSGHIVAPLSRPMTPADLRPTRPYLIGVLTGAAYGIAARVLAEGPTSFRELFGVMTLGFLIVVPVVLGYLTVREIESPSRLVCFFAPWPTCMVTLLVALLLGMEGMICIVLALPVILPLSSFGGFIGGSGRVRRTPGALPVLLLLPYVVAPLEHGRDLPFRLATTRTTIDVAAPVQTIWPLVASVDSIRPTEERPALYTLIGFPHPVSAVIDRHGVGGVREARFTKGLRFTERVTDWRPGHRFSFTIKANTAEIPSTTLDEHVTVGGPYFDVLQGTYELVPLPDGKVRIVLTSEHRLSTPFNAYAVLWTQAIMRSIQSNILDIIKARAERAASLGVARRVAAGVG
jgi:hypothetical protein